MWSELSGLESVVATGVVIVYALTLVLLSIYGLNFFYLMLVAWRHRHDRRDAPALVEFPTVTVQIPIYNERYVAERAIDAACRLDYPSDRLYIQVLDDSTDATREIVAQAVANWRAAGIDIVHQHRVNRFGYKAGALSDGLAMARGEYVAIFDADFVPPRDFLRRIMPHLVARPRVGFVQARWGHLNRNASLLARLQSLNIDSHFLVEQFARNRGGYLMHFNGTGGVWRKRAIEDADGWNVGTLTEDLDLSYRAALRGWQSLLLTDLVVPAELVVDMSAYRRQQTRWAHGTIECAVRLLPVVWRSRLPFRVKVQSFFHLTGYAIQTLMLIMSLVYPFVLTLAGRVPLLNALYSIGWALAPIALAPTLFYLYAQLVLDRSRWWRRIPDVLAMTALGCCMVLNSTRAVLRGLRGRAAAFERTPKSGQVGRRRMATSGDYALPVDPIVLGEMGLCLYNLNTLRLAWSVHSWGIMLYSAFFAAGLAYVAGLSLWQRREAFMSELRSLWSLWLHRSGLASDRSARRIP